MSAMPASFAETCRSELVRLHARRRLAVVPASTERGPDSAQQADEAPPRTSTASITPSDQQNAAIRSIVDWYGGSQQVFYLAGYAGTGKSTTANIAINELKDRYPKIKRVATGAFTGKAAHVLRSKGVEDAMTIHAMIYTPVTDPETRETRFILNPDGAAGEADLIVLDECSMVDEKMARDLLSFGKKVLVMGDPGQLPPVAGQGFFTERTPDAFLQEVHRQAKESPIVRVATMVRNGQIPRFGRVGEVEVLPLNRDTQHHVYAPDTQVICGVHRVRWAYTSRIRALHGFEGMMPGEGERVMCCRNDHDLGVYNGMTGTTTAKAIQAVDPRHIGLWELDVEIDDEKRPRRGVVTHAHLFGEHLHGKSQPPRLKKGVGMWDFGYVLTCHKAQGSEYPHVTVVDDSGSFGDDRFRWLYTACTRPSEGLTLLLRD